MDSGCNSCRFTSLGLLLTAAHNAREHSLFHLPPVKVHQRDQGPRTIFGSIEGCGRAVCQRWCPQMTWADEDSQSGCCWCFRWWRGWRPYWCIDDVRGRCADSTKCHCRHLLPAGRGIHGGDAADYHQAVIVDELRTLYFASSRGFIAPNTQYPTHRWRAFWRGSLFKPSGSSGDYFRQSRLGP